MGMSVTSRDSSRDGFYQFRGIAGVPGKRFPKLLIRTPKLWDFWDFVRMP